MRHHRATYGAEEVVILERPQPRLLRLLRRGLPPILDHSGDERPDALISLNSSAKREVLSKPDAELLYLDLPERTATQGLLEQGRASAHEGDRLWTFNEREPLVDGRKGAGLQK